MAKEYTEVAPRVGAWIEIPSVGYCEVRGYVAPRVGAWIEIVPSGKVTSGVPVVAPRVGAWIEIISTPKGSSHSPGRSSRRSVD